MNNIDELKAQSLQFAKNGQWNDQSFELNKKIIEIDPNCVESYCRIIGHYMDKYDYLEAKKLCHRILSLDPKNGIAKNRLSEIIDIEKTEKERKRAEEYNRALEQDRKNRLKSDDYNYINLVFDALKDPFLEKVNVLPTKPTPEDMELIQLWRNIKDKKSDEDRLLSARLAEKAVADFYRAQGNHVDDISVTQNINQDGGDWERYDLMVDGKQPIDVKNARRFKNDSKWYTNLCVPSFKTEKRNLNQVMVAGVLSFCDWSLDMRRGRGKPILILGTTTNKLHNELQEEFSGDYLTIDFHENIGNSKKFLPPWMFNYPQGMYKKRDSAFEKLRTKSYYPSIEVCEKENINPIPTYISARLKHNYNLSTSLTELESTLRLKISKLGLLLPVIFLSILDYFLRQIYSNSPEFEDPNNYRKIIFPTNDLTRPLFVYDPLMTIDELIQCISIIWKKKQVVRLKKFKKFKLKGHHILLGITDKNIEFTLLAYCGKCGYSPLVFGKHDSCNLCHKLICPKLDCSFCSDHLLIYESVFGDGFKS